MNYAATYTTICTGNILLMLCFHLPHKGYVVHLSCATNMWEPISPSPGKQHLTILFYKIMHLLDRPAPPLTCSPQETSTVKVRGTGVPIEEQKAGKGWYIIRARFSETFTFGISTTSCLEQPESVNIHNMLHNAFVEAVMGEVGFFFWEWGLWFMGTKKKRSELLLRMTGCFGAKKTIWCLSLN